MRRIPRLLRAPLYLLGGWLALFVVVQVLTLVAGAAARWAGKDPQLRAEDWPAVTHLRLIGDTGEDGDTTDSDDGDSDDLAAGDAVAFGAQPAPEDYEALAERGVTTVVDFREGSPAPRQQGRDDPEALARLGIDYHPLPVTDGEAPSRREIREFLAIVEEADGIVYAHCSGGVGRSTSMAAVLQAARGHDPSVLEQVAVGPPTIEQMWFVATLRPGHPEHRITPVIAVVSRVIDYPRTLWGMIG